MPKKSNKRKVAFKLSAPQAQTVLLAADFTEWDKSAVALKKFRSGLWKGAVSLALGSYEYRFIVDGQWWADPANPNRRWNRFGVQNSVCEVSVDAEG